MENLMRNCFLFLSKNKTITKLAKKYGLRLGASRFVAGESVDQAVQIIKNMNKKGLVVTVDYLGEFVNSENEALNMTNQTIKTIEAIGKENLDAQVSLKLTSLGLDISEELVMTNFRRIINKAREYQVFVTIDMEDYERCEKTLEIYKTFKKEYEHLGTVIQAYLYRAEKDIKELDAYDASLRLVKGAYKESSEVAFPDKKDVDENFKKLIRLHLENGNFTAIATHDDAIIEYTKQLVKELNIPKDQYEFQMLYGIRTDRQFELIQEGYPMRVYVPYGTDWYGYYMRRLAERPANVWFVVKNMFKK
ncbi:proline dehydrogenase [Caldibacillus thermolactis]|jgi:proline dehydrogenase|uniref:proline dehydrogenase n=1 Tax=Pallidibacillus thermolactis TaxID=251051 RepID=A0ABT2WD96_9BACI|nr:proline dehydrogenase [Pallidibacillus thermolactis]MCU9593480.1 proline dehydrogenase [Pallidibacillus thermolactis]